jgi:hypothetical protein
MSEVPDTVLKNLHLAKHVAALSESNQLIRNKNLIKGNVTCNFPTKKP